ncbi:hypothetical protein EGI11_11510 [Chryseobacterium sp. H3056]|uniref:Uncharacterized protein n=1 Tax=Kaistella daneshvariae TaxID=2487074 RepID=A0A3N0WVW3_9FLAO|nr:hypothetical protein EGI11_11510 [Kaistella daneshvariae]
MAFCFSKKEGTSCQKNPRNLLNLRENWLNSTKISRYIPLLFILQKRIRAFAAFYFRKISRFMPLFFHFYTCAEIFPLI